MWGIQRLINKRKNQQNHSSVTISPVQKDSLGIIQTDSKANKQMSIEQKMAKVGTDKEVNNPVR